MQRYLFTTLPSNDLGLLTRALPIADALRARGHHVTFCSPARAPRKLIADAGFDHLLPVQSPYYLLSGDLVSFESFRRLLRGRHLVRDLRLMRSFAGHVRRSSTAEIRDVDHFMYLFGMGIEALVRVNVEAIMELIRLARPDAVVDFWNPFACIAARACGIPLITVIQADMHPASRGFIWWKDVPRTYPSPIPATNTIRAEHHLPPVRSMGELLTGDLTLVVGIPETDPLPPGADVTYIGPLLWEKEGEALPEAVTALRGDRPLIWLYPGNLRYASGTRTFGDSEVILRACVDALGGASVHVVLTTGHHALPRRFEPLPASFLHLPYVPGLAMAARSDLLIHHGGYGSCQTGLYTGKPALILPTYSERESNARRAADVGAATYILPTSDASGRNKQVAAEAVRTRVFEMLSDASFGARARQVSERMKAFGGARKAAQHIEDFIRGGRSTANG